MQLRKHILFLAVAIGISASAQQSSVNVLHYDIHLTDINFPGNTITATTTVTLAAESNVSTFGLELKSLTVDSISSSTHLLSGFSQLGETLTINLSNPIAAGDTARFSISYSGIPFHESWGGLYFEGRTLYNLGVGISSNPHNLGKTWFPCADNFTDRATYDVEVDVPSDLTVACGGVFIDTVAITDGLVRWHWSIPQEIPTYLVSIAVSNYVWYHDSVSGLNGEIPISIFVRPGDQSKIGPTFANLKTFVQFFEQCFGPYPFNRIGYVETSIGCMEHIDNIALASGLFDNSTNDYSDKFIAHELSHAWFGDQTTCSSAGDMWLNEGFATFCEMYYLNSLYGGQSYREAMSKTINQITTTCHITEGWVPLNSLPTDITYGTTAYKKGAIVVHSLMNYLTPEVFFPAIRHYLTKHAYRSVSSEDLRDALSEYTGTDLTDFFNAWIFTPGAPHYSIDSVHSEPNGNQYDVRVCMRQKHRGSDYVAGNVRFNLGFVKPDWTVVSRTVSWNGEHGCDVVTLDFEPLLVIADYYNDFADAQTAVTEVIQAAGTTNFADMNFQLLADNVTDSVMIHIENNWIAPDSLQIPVPGLHLNPARYYTVQTISKPNDRLRGRFTYKVDTSLDDGLTTSDNDTIVLVYRPHAGIDWQIVADATVQYTELFGYYYADLNDGDYTFAAIDRNHVGLNEIGSKSPMSVYPNPARHSVTISWNRHESGSMVLFNMQGNEVCQTAYTDTDRITLKVKGLPAGVYFIQRSDLSGNVKDCKKVVIR